MLPGDALPPQRRRPVAGYPGLPPGDEDPHPTNQDPCVGDPVPVAGAHWVTAAALILFRAGRPGCGAQPPACRTRGNSVS